MTTIRNFWVLILAAALAGLATGYILFAHPNGSDGKDEPQGHGGSVEPRIWTCAMHPQIRQNSPGQCPICGMDLIPLDGPKAGHDPLVMEMTEDAVQLAGIRTIEVGTAGKTTSQSIRLAGRIQSDERRLASQVVHVPGRIETLSISFTGETVRKGQPLATMYSPELVLAQKELQEATRLKGTNPRLLEASRTKLRYWKIPDTLITEWETSKDIHPTITLYADKTGVVVKRHVSVGDYVKEGDVLFDLADLRQLWVTFDAYEEDLANLRIGDLVEYTAPSLPGRTFRSRITFIDPVIDPQTRVAYARAEVANTGGLLKPEMLVKGVVHSGNMAGPATITVPRTAVLWTGQRSVVYVEVPDAPVPSYAFREVILGDPVGDQYIVRDGLVPGERVVVNGAFVIDASAQLNNRASMLNRMVRVRKDQSVIQDYLTATPDAFRDQLGRLAKNYLKLKDALVQTDSSLAKHNAGVLLTSLAQVDMDLLGGQAHQYWMDIRQNLQAHANGLARAGGIQNQRLAFRDLTKDLVTALKAFGSRDSLFLIHCPMAFSNEGADWINDSRQVENPYYGEKMLHCGSLSGSMPVSPR